MNQSQFNREMMRARTMQKLDPDPLVGDYWIGYQRGLRRAFHGESYGTADEHETWLACLDAGDERRRRRGQGYSDGLNYSPSPGRPTDEKRRHYDLSIRPSVMARVEALGEKEGLSRSAMVDRILAEATLAR